MSPKLPKAYRDSQNPSIYRDPQNLWKLEPDRVPPVVQGYFRLPAVWIGEGPATTGRTKYDPAFNSEVKVEEKLRCGIIARALRDGTFLFNFAESLLAPITVIPGFSYPAEPKPWQAYPDAVQAERLAEQRAIFRSRLLNVHQLLLSEAEREVDRQGAMTGFPVTPWTMIDSINFQVEHRNREHQENLRDLSGRVLNMHYEVERPEIFTRRIISIDAARRSFQLLDELVLHEDESLITILEEAYKTGCHERDGRYGESIISGWTVCEQIVAKIWDKYLHSKSVSGERKKKLKGIDYTASIRIEMLNLAGLITPSLFQMLEAARKARNNWVHKMQHPTREDINNVRGAAEDLIKSEFGITTHLFTGGWSGTPSFPYWTYEQAKDR